MTRTSVSVRRTAALSVCFALFSASVALAQTPASSSGNPAPNPRLLNNAAFARLVGQEPTVVAAPINVKDVARIDLRRAMTVPAENRAQAQFAPQGTQKQSHKIRNGIILGAIGVFLAVLVCLYACPE